MSVAWDVFGEKNGAPNLSAFQRLVRAHRSDDEHDPHIGCVILNEPFFFPRDKWLPVPLDWARNIVAGKVYDSNSPVGRELWEQAAQSINEQKHSENESELALAEGSRFGNEYLARGRLGHGAFRILVTSAYRRKCAITGEKTLPVLQAAHIRPFVDKGPNVVRNGILLRSDLHILFDRGYLTVTPDQIVEVSRKIKDEYENGKEYYPFHGHPLQTLPDLNNERPHGEYLQWHNENVYLG